MSRIKSEADQDFHYCSGEVCHTPKELFDLLADDYRTYVEIELTNGRRELTEDDEREADALHFFGYSYTMYRVEYYPCGGAV